jgi:predicted RNase H-like nuclease
MTAWGLDRARGRWAVVRLEGDTIEMDLIGGASELVLGADATVAVDIPLAPFPDTIGRRCETEAREILGGRSSTIFPTLPRWCYGQPYDDGARHEARRRYGKAYSKQAWNLGPAILDIDAVRDHRWHETHPELAFARRNGGRPAPSKTSWDGIRARLDILSRAGVEVPMGGFTLPVPPHDVLDAVVCALVARDIAAGEARQIPWDATADEATIWY